MNLTHVPTLAAVLGAVGILASAAFAADLSPSAERGRVVYVKQNCLLCHGLQGQGYPGPSRYGGPVLAPHPLPLDVMTRQIRTPRANMPAYDANLISDQEIADMRAYFLSIPNGKPATAIAALAAVNTGSVQPSAAIQRGQNLFSENCSRCHGVAGTEGGAAPSLFGERTKKDLAAAIAFIKNPPTAMPKLFPAPLSEQDVADVAAYVESL
jgi:mono/diheme cytochrome c family protein